MGGGGEEESFGGEGNRCLVLIALKHTFCIQVLEGENESVVCPQVKWRRLQMARPVTEGVLRECVRE